MNPVAAILSAIFRRRFVGRTICKFDGKHTATCRQSPSSFRRGALFQIAALRANWLNVL